MQPLAFFVLRIFELPEPVHLPLARITLVKIVPSGIADRLQPLIHGIPCETHIHLPERNFFCQMAAWLTEVVVRAVALLSALTKEFNMHIIQC